MRACMCYILVRFVCMYAFVCMLHVCLYACIRACMYACMHAYMHAYMHPHVLAC